MKRPLPTLAGLILLLVAVTLVACSSSDDPANPAELPVFTADPRPVGDLHVASGAGGAITLAWTSPALQEKAYAGIGYQLRYALLALASDEPEGWAEAPAPQRDAASGVAHHHTLSGLQEGQVYIFALRATTDGENWSEFTAPVVATAAPLWDTTAPEAVQDLRLEETTATALTVNWPACGNDGPYGQADGYEVRYATEEFTEQEWDQAETAAGDQVEQDGRLHLTIGGLLEGQTYHVAVRAYDAAGNRSAMSPLLAAAPGQGRIWYVNVEGTGDAPTIEAAIDLAAPGDEIVVGPGRYSWTNQGTGDRYGLILIARDRTGFTLRSEEGPEATILDAESQGGVIHIQGYNDITIDGFTITRGNVDGNPDSGEPYAGGGIVSHLASPVIRNCIIKWNNATEGGGVWLGSTGRPVLEDCIIAGNTADLGAGVALVNDAQLITITRCKITGNIAAESGGALRAYNVLLRLEDCLLAGNTSHDLGGAVSAVSLHEGSELVGCTIIANEGVRGSALRVYGNTDLAVRRSVIAFNEGGPAFSAEFQGALTLGCSDVFGHPQGQAYPELFTDEGGNFQADPLLCDLTAGLLRSDSPCVEGQHPDGQDCGRIGARPVGCAAPR